MARDELIQMLQRTSRLLRGWANPQSIDFLAVATLATDIETLVANWRTEATAAKEGKYCEFCGRGPTCVVCGRDDTKETHDAPT